MNKGYWSFNDFIKSSSFCTIKTLDISNTDAKVKISQPKNSYSFIISKINPGKICQNVDPKI